MTVRQIVRSVRSGLWVVPLVACDLSGPSGFAFVRVNPVLDSIFIGDQIPPRSVIYYDSDGNPRTPSPGEIRWRSSDTAIIGVDAAGTINGRKRGRALVIARVQDEEGSALIAVSNALDLTNLLDTVYVMPGDTIPLPVAIVQKPPASPPTVWFDRSPDPARYTIDTTTGVVSATQSAQPGATRYVAHAGAGADTVADTGAVVVVSLTDTTGGRFFFSVLGTANFHGRSDSVRAVNYSSRRNGRLAFRLRGVYDPTDTRQVVQVILPDSLVVADSAYAIDSLSPLEAERVSAGQYEALCIPPRPWASWSFRSSSPSEGIVAYSRRGTLGVTQIRAVQNGFAVSGRFAYTAQRADIYVDPLGLLSIHGSFVAPLVTDRASCPP